MDGKKFPAYDTCKIPQYINQEFYENFFFDMFKL